MPKPASKTRNVTADTKPFYGPVIAFTLADGALPNRVKIANWGENIARSVKGIGQDQKFVVNEATLAALPTMQRKVGYDLIALDFEHQTHKGSANYIPPPHNVAGHGRIEVIAGEGIFYIAEDYTPHGRKHAADYPDLSGVFWPNKNGEVVFVSSVALCQNGSVDGIHFKEAEMRALAASIAASLDDMAGMDAEDRVIALTRQMLGFGEDATPEDVAAAIEAILRQRAREAEARSQQDSLQKKAQPENPNSTNKTDTMDTTELAAQVTALAASVKQIADGQATVLKSITETAAKAATDAHNATVEAEIAAAVKLGKVVPATVRAKSDDGRYKLDAASAKEILDCITATVNTEFEEGQAKPGSSAAEAATVDKEVCAALGIDADAWKKGGISRALEPAPSGVIVA